MALDPEDCVEEPYGLGYCYEYAIKTEVECQTWCKKNNFIPVRVRRRGSVTQILVPEIIYQTNKNGTKDIIQFHIGLSSDEDKKKLLLGNYPKTQRIVVEGLNGCARNSDELTNEIVPINVTMDFEGNFYIAPAEDDEGFTASEDLDQVGVFSFVLSFIPNDIEEEEETEEPEEKEAKLEE